MAERPYPVQVEFELPTEFNRFWAVPLIGFLVKLIILIPHIAILYFFGIVVGFLQLIIWVPVLFGGRYPEWGVDLVGGYIRWSTRVLAYFYGLTDEYPPFRATS